MMMVSKLIDCAWEEALKLARTTPNPKVILWAMERVHKEPSDFTGISKCAEQWVTGEKIPTVKQMQKLAAKTHVPFPYFYDDTVPSMSLQIPDYRTTYFGSAENPSPELYDTINLMQSRQDWLSAFLEDSGNEPLSFIGACVGNQNAKGAVSLIRSMLSLEDGWAHSLRTDEAVRLLREKIESAGVYTCAGSFFHHGSRPYDVSEFRGFVLADDYAPIIFLNTQDAKSAQLFTLIHEFAHLLFNETGVDDLAYEIPEKEGLCDSVAAEVLVPASLVFAFFDQMPTEEAVSFLRKTTKASEIVCLRRARELGCITRDDFFRIYGDYKRRLGEICKAERKRRGGGPSYYIVQKSMLGGLFADTVFEGVKSESLLFSDAYRLTDMKASSFKKFYAEEDRYL